MSMFCYQCQEAAFGKACNVVGVCGKTPEVSDLQDLLVYQLKGISLYTNRLRNKGIEIHQANKFITDSLFMTITNANFNHQRFVNKIYEGFAIRENAQKLLTENGSDVVEIKKDCVFWTANDGKEMELKAKSIGVLSTENEDIRSLRELIIYGVKGIAAYSEHASNLKIQDVEIDAFIQKALEATTNDSLQADDLVALVLETGKFGVQVMALLDKANTTAYGNPEITKVKLGVRSNPAILISGHDLKDMEELLKQTDGTGVDVYTHSEMLPAHYYPAFKKYTHFVGNYGGSWWSQVSDFEKFNGVVLFTTNCIVPPRKDATYVDRVYTTGASGYPDFKHISDGKDGKSKDFSALIAHAKTFAAPTEIETGEIVGGFAHAQLFALADKIVDAVKSGAIRRFFVMAGCDGRMKDRNYYTEFAKALPSDTIILTAGCAKYRYNKLALGDIGGIPRVLDAGQCNDSYSLAVIALKLKEVFELNDINELPITYNIAWYEQKAVIVLLALLYLGVKNIHLGPTLPAFLSPNVAKILVENFGIAPIGSVDKDLKLFLSQN